MSSAEYPRCRLCGRRPRRGTTEHHLIPRSCHRNKWFQKRFSRQQMGETISVCRDCHSSIHRFVPRAKDLGRHYHTVEALLSHEQIARFITWVRRQR